VLGISAFLHGRDIVLELGCLKGYKTDIWVRVAFGYYDERIWDTVVMT
jgi:hypothetical protein